MKQWIRSIIKCLIPICFCGCWHWDVYQLYVLCISYLIAKRSERILWVWNEALGLLGIKSRQLYTGISESDFAVLWNRIELLGKYTGQSFILCSRKRLGAGMLRCKQRAGTFYLGIMFCSEFPGEGICRNPLLY